MYRSQGPIPWAPLRRGRLRASADVKGGPAYPALHGTVELYDTASGVLVLAWMQGLPHPSDPCAAPVFAFHIHDGVACTGNEADPFANAGTHYDPKSCPHPYHAGDMPPLFGAGGYAFSAFLTTRFRIEEVIGKAVVVHAGVDDFSSQPAGNAGEKIACGSIRAAGR